METRSPEFKAELTVRLRRIEGQVRGVQRMIEEDRDCPDILQQVLAARAALQQASLQIVRAYAARCLKEPSDSNNGAVLETLITALGKLE